MRKAEIVVTFLIFFGLYILIVPQMLLARYKINASPTAVPVSAPTPTPGTIPDTMQSPASRHLATSTLTPTPSPTLIPVRKPKLTSPTPSSPDKIGVKSGPKTLTNPTNISSKDSIILQDINNYRKGKGLPVLSASSVICSFAKVRAQEISTNFNHDGFQKRVDSKTLPYPSYSIINENIVMTSDFHQVITLWVNSPGHMANLSSNITYGCIGDYGNYYAFEGWKP